MAIHFIILIFLFSFPFLELHLLNNASAECDVDLSTETAPPIDQGGTEMCYAFAGTALLEQMNGVKKREDRYSVLDGAIQYKKTINSREDLQKSLGFDNFNPQTKHMALHKISAGTSTYVIEAVQKKGACLERDFEGKIFPLLAEEVFQMDSTEYNPEDPNTNEAVMIVHVALTAIFNITEMVKLDKKDDCAPYLPEEGNEKNKVLNSEVKTILANREKGIAIEEKGFRQIVNLANCYFANQGDLGSKALAVLSGEEPGVFKKETVPIPKKTLAEFNKYNSVVEYFSALSDKYCQNRVPIKKTPLKEVTRLDGEDAMIKSIGRSLKHKQAVGLELCKAAIGNPDYDWTKMMVEAVSHIMNTVNQADGPCPKPENPIEYTNGSGSKFNIYIKKDKTKEEFTGILDSNFNNGVFSCTPHSVAIIGCKLVGGKAMYLLQDTVAAEIHKGQKREKRYWWPAEHIIKNSWSVKVPVE